MRKHFLARFGLAAALALVSAAAGQTVHIPLRQVTLNNGLRVILSEDHSAPTCSINLTYDVGSRNEQPGHTGLAHLFEHMMFEGTPAVPKGQFDDLIFANGGNANASTNKDRTNFYETLLSNQLVLGLYLEADRMRTLPQALTQAKLDNQRQAVQEERRLRVDNVPYGKSGEILDALAYDNPNYRHSVIGSMDDLNAASLADVAAFFKTYYAPNNAVLVVVGDFQTAHALTEIKKYFGSIPRQATPAQPDMSQPDQTAERRQTVTDPFAQFPRVDFVYRIPAGNTPDWYAMDVLASVLTAGRSSRLYQDLVQKRQLATRVSAFPEDMRGPSEFRLSATPRPGTEPAVLEAAVEAGLAEVAANGVTQAEVDKIVMDRRADLIQQDQSTLGRANQIGEYAVFFHDPELINTRIDHYTAVTPAAVQQAARRYLGAANRTVVTTLPAPPAARAAAAAAGAVPAAAPPSKPATASAVPSPISSLVPLSATVPRVQLPKPVSLTLPNGLTVLILEDHRLPIVTSTLQIPGAGALLEPAGQSGLATLAAQMSSLGTATHTAAEIANSTAQWGAVIGIGAPYGALQATLSASGLSSNFDQWFPLAVDELLHPSFPAAEFSRLIQQTSVSLRQQRTQPAFLAYQGMNQAVYGAYPAAVTATDPATLGNLTRDDLVRWHTQRYTPQHAILAISGDVRPATLIPQLRTLFAAWQTAPGAGAGDLPPAPVAPAAKRIFLIDRPGSVQTTLYVGNLALTRDDPDYVALSVLNQLLGAGPQSRMFVDIRENQGLAYDVASSYSASQYPGVWRAGGDFRTAVTGQALTALLAEIARAGAEPAPANELLSAKRATVARFALSLESPANVLYDFVNSQTYGFGPRYWDDFPARVMALTAGDLQRVARKYYDPSRLQIVAVGDAAAIRPMLEKFGPVELSGGAKPAAGTMPSGQ